MIRKILLLLAIWFAQPMAANAGLFDDDEARKSIRQLTEKIEAQSRENDTRFLKLDESIKGLGIIQLLNQIEALNGEIARLRGQIEVLANQSEQLQKRQKDFYLDIDTRLRVLEGGNAPSSANANLQSAITPSATSVMGTPANGGLTTSLSSPVASAGLPASPVATEAVSRDRENRAYDVGSAAFRRGDFAAAMRAFQTFIADFPQSQLTSNAVYWVGLAQFNLKDFREARVSQESLIKRYPDSSKVPDALLVIASIHAETGDAGLARNTFEDIIAKYPTSDAAAKARTRLSGIRK